jgi:hypothetical protein
MKTPRFCLFRNIGEKEVAAHDENCLPVTFATEREALIEALSELEEHIAQFKCGSRNYDEIMFNCDEYVEPVMVDERGHVFDEDGNEFGKRED